MQAMFMSKQVKHIISGPGILHGNWTASWKSIILSLTLLFLVKLTSSFLTIHYNATIRGVDKWVLGGAEAPPNF